MRERRCECNTKHQRTNGCPFVRVDCVAVCRAAAGSPFSPEKHAPGLCAFASTISSQSGQANIVDTMSPTEADACEKKGHPENNFQYREHKQPIRPEELPGVLHNSTQLILHTTGFEALLNPVGHFSITVGRFSVKKICPYRIACRMILDCPSQNRCIARFVAWQTARRPRPRSLPCPTEDILQPVLLRSSAPGGLMWSERKQGHFAKRVSVSASGGSSTISWTSRTEVKSGACP